MLLNTSFNIAGEPIVETPQDALWCALFSGLDRVAFEHVVVGKTAEFAGMLYCVPVPIRDPVRDIGGVLVHLLSDGDEEVFLKCDGERTGMEIRSLLGADVWSELRLLRALAFLTRTRWVRFSH